MGLYGGMEFIEIIDGAVTPEIKAFGKGFGE